MQVSDCWKGKLQISKGEKKTRIKWASRLESEATVWIYV